MYFLPKKAMPQFFRASFSSGCAVVIYQAHARPSPALRKASVSLLDCGSMLCRRRELCPPPSRAREQRHGSCFARRLGLVARFGAFQRGNEAGIYTTKRIKAVGSSALRLRQPVAPPPTAKLAPFADSQTCRKQWVGRQCVKMPLRNAPSMFLRNLREVVV